MSRKEFKIDGIAEANPNKFGGMVSRAISLGERAKGKIDWEQGIDTVATSENPALVVDWERWQVVREILPMRYREAPASGKVPLLDSHNRSSVDKVKGSARNFTIDGINLMCKTFISSSDPVTRQKIEEGHIDSVSIGYMTDKDFTVEIPKGAEVTVDGVAYRNNYTDGYPMVIRTWWQEHELSLVPIGADATAKFKSAGEFENKDLIEKIVTLEKEIQSLKQKDEPENVERGLTYHEAQVRLLKYM